MLLNNGKKIVELNQSVEKAEQEATEQELEFITAQHAKLESVGRRALENPAG